MPPGSSPAPYTKGEGQSLMVADFVSADYGWLHSPNRTESACILFKAGKDHDGCLTNDDIITQLESAINILQKHYPDKNHIFIYDNATTHQKWENSALSASKMTKGPSNKFFVEVNIFGENGKLVYAPNGKLLK